MQLCIFAMEIKVMCKKKKLAAHKVKCKKKKLASQNKTNQNSRVKTDFRQNLSISSTSLQKKKGRT